MELIEEILEREKAKLEPEKKGQTEEERMVSYDFLVALKNNIGFRRAIEIAGKYDGRDIARGDGLLSSFQFVDEPNEYPERLEVILSLLDIDKETKDEQMMERGVVDLLSRLRLKPVYLSDLVETIGAVKSEVANKQRETVYGFIRENILSVGSAVLHKYGVETEAANVNRDFALRIDNTIRVLKGVKLQDFVAKVVQASADGRTISYHGIIEGFRDWEAAFEFMLKSGSDSEASKYIALGLTSKQAVLDTKSHEVTLVVDTFGTSANEYVSGDVEKFNALVELAKKEGSEDYLKALGGSVRFTKAVMDMSDRPSAGAIRYVTERFGTEGIGEIVRAARAIDDEDERIFEIDASSLVEFTSARTAYKTAAAKFEGDTGETLGFVQSDIDFVAGYEGDLRFFRDFSISEAERVEVITNAGMVFDDYDVVAQKGYGRIVPDLIEAGYEVDDIAKLQGSAEEGDMEIVLQGLPSFVRDSEEGKREIDIETLEMLAGAGNSTKVAEYLSEANSDLFEMGVEYSTIPLFVSNGIETSELRTFMGSVKMAKYYDEDQGFDVQGFMTDYRLFHNLDGKE